MSAVPPPQVVGVFAPGPVGSEVSVLVEEAGFRMARWLPRELLRLPEWAGPVVIEVSVVRGIGAPRGPLPYRPGPGPWIGVTGPADRVGASSSLPAGLDSVFEVPRERGALLTAVRWGWVSALERRACAATRSRVEWHACVASAVRMILRQRCEVVGGGGRGGGEGGAARVGLLAWLGKEVGISVDHLSRLTSADATRLREVFDAWRMVLATVVWMEEGSWERVAWRLGYKGPSGVTALARRTLGRCPQELSRDPGQVLALAEARIMGLVAGPGERKSDGVNECGIG